MWLIFQKNTRCCEICSTEKRKRCIRSIVPFCWTEKNSTRCRYGRCTAESKHIRITKEQIVNYRIAAQEERKYEWSQVLGAYNRKEEIVLCTKKDEQIMTLDKSKLSESEMKFITDIIDERHLWRTSMPIRTVYLMFGAITFVGVTWIVQAVLKVM